MSYTGEVKVFFIVAKKGKRVVKEAWVFADTDEHAIDEMAGREAMPFVGLMFAEEVNADEEIYLVCDDPNDSELILTQCHDWEEPELREGFTVTKLKTGKFRVTGPAWRWAEAYEATLGNFVLSIEPKVLCSR